MTNATRYNRTSLANLITTLQAWIDQSGDSLATAEDADYLNDERIDMLTARIDSLNEAVDALEGIE